MSAQSTKTKVAVPILVGAVILGLVALIGLGSDNPKVDDCLPGSATSGSTVTAGAKLMPLKAGTYKVGSPFGPRDGAFHYGQDFEAPLGTPIYAALDGTVRKAGPASGFGTWVVIDSTVDGKQLSTVYGHEPASSLKVHEGDKVSAGTQLAAVGSEGESSGPHLHFEVWPGGRLDGGKAVDPMPWLKGAGDPGGTGQSSDPAQLAAVVGPASPDASTPASPRAPPAGDASATPAAAVGGDLPPLLARMGSEAHWQVDTVRVARTVAQKFPQLQTIGGWRPQDAYPDHPSGRAADIMIPGWDTPAGKALGDQIADYVMANKDVFQVQYIIWRQVYRPAQNASNTMEDRGSPTQNHFDHVHVTTVGHGMPTPGQRYGLAPGGVTQGPAAGAGAGCGPAAPGAGGAGLRPGSVPAAFEPWIIKAGTTCAEVPAPIIAAQLENESGFNVEAYNAGSRATGPAQFLPETWAAKGVDGDGNGTKDPRSIPDAVMTQAAYDCELAKIAKDDLAKGKLKGDLTELYLSMYNCGPGATEAQGGVCQNSQTLNYVRNIPAAAQAKFAGAANLGISGGTFGARVVAAAARWRGQPYVWGGGDIHGPTGGQGGGQSGFDCSGLALNAIATASGGQIVLNHLASDQLHDPRGRSVPTVALAPGDLVFPAGDNPGHVAIYAGNGQMVEAPDFGQVVKVSPVANLGAGFQARRFG